MGQAQGPISTHRSITNSSRSGIFDAAAVSGQTYSKLGPLGRGEGKWGKSEIDKNATFDVDDLAVALIKLKSGRIVLLEASWASHHPQHDYFGSQVFGTDAGLLLNPLRLIRPGKKGYITEEVALGTPLANENRMVHFIDVLIGKAQPLRRHRRVSRRAEDSRRHLQIRRHRPRGAYQITGDTSHPARTARRAVRRTRLFRCPTDCGNEQSAGMPTQP